MEVKHGMSAIGVSFHLGWFPTSNDYGRKNGERAHLQMVGFAASSVGFQVHRWDSSRHPNTRGEDRCLNPKTSPEAWLLGFPNSPPHQVFGGFCLTRVSMKYPTPKLTYPLKQQLFQQGKYIFQPFDFRGYVSFQASICWFLEILGIWVKFCFFGVWFQTITILRCLSVTSYHHIKCCKKMQKCKNKSI